ncbi:MAG: Nif3-like dinuclear metal center hexameric protein, partial [Candidatus Syntrophonatronum acetioxidans]
SLICDTVKKDITVYSPHTNLDIAEEGVNKRLADLLRLEKQRVLKPTYREKIYKIVVFIPEGYEDKVKKAMTEKGAGWFGNYSHCTFSLEGRGAFKPLEGTDPFRGEKGMVKEVSEVRLETAVTEGKKEEVIESMLKAHPYAEVAYDLYPLENRWKTFGLGITGSLPQEKNLGELVKDLKERLGIDRVKVVGAGTSTVKKVALCGGSGGDLVEKAASEGADLFITGDLKYHQAQEARGLGLSVIDAGHDSLEKVIVPYLVEFLKDRLKESNFQNRVILSEVNTSPWNIW